MLRMLLIILSFSIANAETFTTIYQFGAVGGTLSGPLGPMVQNSQGVLYGTSSADYGAFFSLSPPTSTGGQWTATALYEFGVNGGDGQYPSGVVAGPHGAMYGTTAAGGAYSHGTVFQITPPTAPGGSWTETVL